MRDNDFFGGAVLADSTCGSASFTTHSGDVLTFKVDHDPEFTMSGLDEPCSSFDQW
jgi:hypothetical protein